MRLAVWRCFLGGLRFVLQDPVDDAGVGLLRSLSKGWDARGGVCRQQPGGTEQAGILRTASRYSPNVRAASRMIIPSTITVRRTRRYTSTLYIRRTIRWVVSDSMDGGGRSDLQPPNVSDYRPAWNTSAPPFTHRSACPAPAFSFCRALSSNCSASFLTDGVMPAVWDRRR